MCRVNQDERNRERLAIYKGKVARLLESPYADAKKRIEAGKKAGKGKKK